MRINATESGANAIKLFIAELNGIKTADSMEHKTQLGHECWLRNTLPKVNLDNEEDRKELNEIIWLERLYEELDGFYNLTHLDKDERLTYKALSLIMDTGICSNPNYQWQWTTPIELDAGASMLQVEAMLLGDAQLARATNMIGTKLSDPWHIQNLKRVLSKGAGTPQFYASSQTAQELWENSPKTKGKYTFEDVVTYQQALTKGHFAVAVAFKDFIIHSVNPTETMTVKIWNDEFTIKCNRFRREGDITKEYKIFDSTTQKIRRVHHTTTKAIPDLVQFRRYFVTLLVHNIDSQIANEIASRCYDKYKWVIDIHDAFIVNPEAAADVRKWYGELMEELFSNRKQILRDFFLSVGIRASAQTAWNNLQKMIEPMETFKCNPMALK